MSRTELVWRFFEANRWPGYKPLLPGLEAELTVYGNSLNQIFGRNENHWGTALSRTELVWRFLEANRWPGYKPLLPGFEAELTVYGNSLNQIFGQNENHWGTALKQN